jgi:8-oxo-dGTP pyrophosphatase MutT (NUDIX family)
MRLVPSNILSTVHGAADCFSARQPDGRPRSQSTLLCQFTRLGSPCAPLKVMVILLITRPSNSYNSVHPPIEYHDRSVLSAHAKYHSLDLPPAIVCCTPPVRTILNRLVHRNTLDFINAMTAHSTNSDLISHLKSVLLELNANPYPHVACPPNLPKRASVALILRVQPSYSHWPDDSDGPLSARRRRSSVVSKSEFNFESSLNAFFAQEWVKHGDPEVLFIKRATRVGDKWNGHVALPGGKRDPEDADDQVTAAREAWEEVGIDLSPDYAIAVGNLPQRIVTTSWGKVPCVGFSTPCCVLSPHDALTIPQTHGTMSLHLPPDISCLPHSTPPTH